MFSGGIKLLNHNLGLQRGLWTVRNGLTATLCGPLFLSVAASHPPGCLDEETRAAFIYLLGGYLPGKFCRASWLFSLSPSRALPKTSRGRGTST